MCLKFTRNVWFDRVILLLIVANCLCLTLGDPVCDIYLDNPQRNILVTMYPSHTCDGYAHLRVTLTVLEIVFTSLFTIEMMLKIIARGLFWHHRSYLRDPWNWVDFIVVIVSIVGLDPRVGNFSAIRTVRVLRPLRTMNRIKGMRTLIMALLRSLKPLVNVAFVCFFVFFVFGIMGMDIFSGYLRGKCYGTEGHLKDVLLLPASRRGVDSVTTQADVLMDNDSLCSVYKGGGRSCYEITGVATAECRWYDPSGNPHPNPLPNISFDDIFDGFLTIFQCISMEGWSDVMYLYEDGHDLWGARLFFISLICIGAFYSINLALAVITHKFTASSEQERQRQLHHANLSPRTAGLGNNSELPEVSTLTILRERFASWLTSENEYDTSTLIGKVRLGLFNFVEHDHFRTTLTLCIIVNTIVLALEYHSQNTLEDNICERVSKDRCTGPLFKYPDVPAGEWAGASYTSTLLGCYDKETREVCFPDKGFWASLSYREVCPDSNTCLGMPFHQQHSLEIINLVLTIIFIVELVLKVAGLGLAGYFKHQANVFDFFIVVASIVELGSQGGTAGGSTLSALRAFRLFRVFKLARSWTGLKMILKTIGVAGSSLGPLAIVLVIFMFICALVGQELFGGEFGVPVSPSDTLAAANVTWVVPRSNFDSFSPSDTGFGSMVTVFQIITGENWNIVMYDGLRHVHWTASIYFIIVVIIGNYMIMNLVLAILLHSFWAVHNTMAEEGEVQNDVADKVEKAKAIAHFLLRTPAAPPVQKRNLAWPEPQSDGDTSPCSNMLLDTPGSPASTRPGLVSPGTRASAQLVAAGCEHTGECDCVKPNVVEDTGADDGVGVVLAATDNAAPAASNGTAANKADQEEEDDEGVEAGRPSDIVLPGSPPKQQKEFLVGAPELSPRWRRLPDLPAPNALPAKEVAGGDDLVQSLCSSNFKGAGVDSVSVNSMAVASMGVDSMGTSCNSMNVNSAMLNSADPRAPHPSPSSTTSVGERKRRHHHHRRRKTNSNLLSGQAAQSGRVHPDSPGSDCQTLHTPYSALPVVTEPLEYRPYVKAVLNFLPVRVFKMLCRRRNNLLIFGPESGLRFLHPVREAAFTVADETRHGKWFDRFILVCIAISTALLIIEHPLDKYRCNQCGGVCSICDQNEVLRYINYALIGVFTAEMLVKVVAYGFIMHADSYLHDAWNLLDFIIVVTSLLSLFFSNSSLKALRTIRAFRALRPLRVLKRNKGMKVSVVCVLRCIPAAVNVGIVCFLFFAIFGVLGVQFFKGRFYACWLGDGPSALLIRQYPHPVTGETTPLTDVLDCAAAGGSWRTPFNGFDSFPMSLLTMFEMATTEGWLEVLRNAVDAKGVGLLPVPNYQPLGASVFVVCLMCCSMFVLSLFVGIVIESYNKTKQEMEGGVVLTAAQREWAEAQLIGIGSTPCVPPVEPTNPLSKLLFKHVVHSRVFETVVSLCIVLNMLVMASFVFNMDKTAFRGLSYLNLIFTGVFIIEAILKLAAMGVRIYMADPWNCFDFFVVAVSIAGAAVDFASSEFTLPGLTILRVFRILRLFRLVKRMKRLRQLMEALLHSLPALVNVGSLLLLFFVIYSTMGVNLFYNVRLYQDPDRWMTRQANFGNFGSAMSLLFRAITGEGWHGIMHYCMQDDPWVSCEDYNNLGDGCGDSVSAVTFFVTFKLFGAFILLNLFVAFILDSFEHAVQDRHQVVPKDDLLAFVTTWMNFDHTANQTLPVSELPNFLRALDPPLGLKGKRLSNAAMVQFISVLDVPSHGGLCHFLEVYLASISRVLRVKMPNNAVYDIVQAEVSSRLEHAFGADYATDATDAAQEHAAGILQRLARNRQRLKMAQKAEEAGVTLRGAGAR